MPDKVCEHAAFQASVVVNRLKDSDSFLADVQVQCAECETRFVFLGVPMGLDMGGAAISVEGSEIRLAIAPMGETMMKQIKNKTYHVRKPKAK